MRDRAARTAEVPSHPSRMPVATVRVALIYQTAGTRSTCAHTPARWTGFAEGLSAEDPRGCTPPEGLIYLVAGRAHRTASAALPPMPTEFSRAPADGRPGRRSGAGGLIAERAYLELRDRIVTLRLPPGAALREDELMRELGIGRTPLREAVKRLSLEYL